MAAGAGKYDVACTRVRLDTDAKAVVLIGKYGSGFSVQIEGQHLTADLPVLLRSLADQIEAS